MTTKTVDIPSFRLDKENHVYYLDEKIIPSVHDILRSAGIIDDTYFTMPARERGDFVHRCCQFLAEDDLDWDTVDENIIGYVKAYEKAINHLDFKVKTCEESLYHPVFLYGVTLDQSGKFMESLSNGDTKEGILEIKSGVMPIWTCLQTAFQAMAKWPQDYLTKVRYGIELHKDGTFRPEKFTDSMDFHETLALIQTYHWKSRRGYFK